mmetsp:Transcript_61619/g.95622  ORF Transcript_61619/g.95622 Transcript_61619/m.95622 type:complete len:85 (-) Transcript_61619:952-1206(-)
MSAMLVHQLVLAHIQVISPIALPGLAKSPQAVLWKPQLKFQVLWASLAKHVIAVTGYNAKSARGVLKAKTSCLDISLRSAWLTN